MAFSVRDVIPNSGDDSLLYPETNPLSNFLLPTTASEDLGVLQRKKDEKVICTLKETAEERNINVLEDDDRDNVFNEGRKRKAEEQLHSDTAEENQIDPEAHVVIGTESNLIESVTHNAHITVREAAI